MGLNLDEKPGTCIIVFTWTMVGITFICVVLRLLVRTSRCQDAQISRITRSRFTLPFRLSDVFVALAWISFMVETALWTASYKNGQFDAPTALWNPNIILYLSTTALKLIYVSQLLYLNTTYFVKLAVIFVFEEFVPRERVWMRRALWTLLGIVLVAWGLRIWSAGFSCWPIERNWTHDLATSCATDKSQWVTFLVFYTTHPLTDILVYLFPFPTLYPLLRSRALSTSQKVGLVASFASGLVCIGVAFGYLGAGLKSPSSYGGNQTEVLYTLYALESTYAILVCCAPAVMGDLILGLSWAKRSWTRRYKMKDQDVQVSDIRGGGTTEGEGKNSEEQVMKIRTAEV